MSAPGTPFYIPGTSVVRPSVVLRTKRPRVSSIACRATHRLTTPWAVRAAQVRQRRLRWRWQRGHPDRAKISWAAQFRSHAETRAVYADPWRLESLLFKQSKPAQRNSWSHWFYLRMATDRARTLPPPGRRPPPADQPGGVSYVLPARFTKEARA